jgi:competence protein ComGC
MNRVKGLTTTKFVCVALIISVLILIALPFLWVRPVCASKDSLGKTMVGIVMRINMAYHEEHSQFLTTLEQVRKEDPTPEQYWQGGYWDISMQNQDETIFVYATVKRKGLYSYAGAVAYDQNAKNEKRYKNYVKVICRTKVHSMTQATAPILVKGRWFVPGEPNLQMRCVSETSDC